MFTTDVNWVKEKDMGKHMEYYANRYVPLNIEVFFYFIYLFSNHDSLIIAQARKHDLA